MSDMENQEAEISLASIFALLIRKIKIIGIACFIGLVVCGGYKSVATFLSERVDENEDTVDVTKETYETQLLQWEIEKEIQEKNLIATEKQRELQFLYNDTAPIMQIDADAVVKTVVSFMVSSDETFTLTSSSGDREMPLAYMAAQKYIDDWKTVDIVSIVNNGITEDAWLREVIYLNTSEVNLVVSSTKIAASAVGVSNISYTSSCPLVLTVFSATEAEGEYLARIISDYILSMKDTVELESFAHTITENQVKQTLIKESAITSYQIQCVKNTNTYTEQIKKLKDNIKAKKNSSPDTPVKQIVKTAFVGAIVIALIVCIWFLIVFIGRSLVSSSFEFAERTRYIYLGGFFRKRSWGDRTADKILNERVFASSDETAAFITSNVGTVLKPGAHILVASTCFKNVDSEEVAFLLETLKKAGYAPVFAGDTVTSSTFIASLNETDSVILLEKRWDSRWQNIETELEVIRRLEKEVSGFVLA